MMLRLKFILFSCVMFALGMSFAQTPQTSVDPIAFSKLLMSVTNPEVLDVRSAQEFGSGFIKGAQNINFNDPDFKSRILSMDRSKTYFVYCLTGARSTGAVDFMRNQGFQKVYELNRGLLAWNHQGLPIESTKTAADTLNKENYEILIRSYDQVVVDFYAPWCGPCKRLEPIMDDLSANYQGKIKVVRINIDNYRELSRALNVDEIPFIKVYKKGKLVNNYIGVISKEELLKNF